jgi:ComEC/Rec2-related protein
VRRSLVAPCLMILATIIAWRMGAAWIVPALLSALLALGWWRGVLVLPLLSGLVGAALAWAAVSGVPPRLESLEGRGRVVLRLEAGAARGFAGRGALDGRVIAALDAPAELVGRRARVDVPRGAGPFAIGDRLLVAGRWRPVDHPALINRRLDVQISVEHPPLVLGQERGLASGMRHGLEAARAALAVGARAHLSEDVAGVVLAFTLGIRGDMARQDRVAFASAGVLHLLAISGLHLGILGALLYGLLRPLLSLRLRWRVGLTDRKLAMVGVVVLTGVYTLLTGGAISTTRAWIMLALYAASFVSERETDALSFLMAAAIGLLLGHPPTLFDPSFQLSFAGVGGLLLAGRVGASLGRPARLIVATWFVFLTTTPVIGAHFGVVPLASPVINLLAVPLFSVIILPLSFAFVVISWLPGPLASWMGGALDPSLSALLGLARGSVSWLPTASSPLAISVIYVSALAGTVAGFVWWRRRYRSNQGVEMG